MITSITKQEKRILWKKAIMLGLDEEKAEVRINRLVEHLKQFKNKLKEKEMSDKEVNQKFKEEFWKLCQEMEV